MKLIFSYALFALIATGTNLVGQWLVFLLLKHPLTIWVALFCGTLVGLLTKYLLDKHYIFLVPNEGVKREISTFTKYSLTGVFTTCLFWGFELFFHYGLAFENAQYYGGGLGLFLGYVVKYQLDKKFVFTGGH